VKIKLEHLNILEEAGDGAQEGRGSVAIDIFCLVLNYPRQTDGPWHLLYLQSKTNRRLLTNGLKRNSESPLMGLEPRLSVL
jgi:hypothetical protein